MNILIYQNFYSILINNRVDLSFKSSNNLIKSCQIQFNSIFFFSKWHKNINSLDYIIFNFIQYTFFNLKLSSLFFKGKFLDNKITFFNRLNDKNIFRKSLKSLNFKLKYLNIIEENPVQIFNFIESLFFLVENSIFINNFKLVRLKLEIKLFRIKSNIYLKLNNNFFFFIYLFSSLNTFKEFYNSSSFFKKNLLFSINCYSNKISKSLFKLLLLLCNKIKKNYNEL